MTVDTAEGVHCQVSIDASGLTTDEEVLVIEEACAGDWRLHIHERDIAVDKPQYVFRHCGETNDPAAPILTLCDTKVIVSLIEDRVSDSQLWTLEGSAMDEKFVSPAPSVSRDEQDSNVRAGRNSRLLLAASGMSDSRNSRWIFLGP